MDRIKETRTRLNMGQKEVAYALGVSQPTVSAWESGGKDPTVENLSALAELFRVSTDYLLGRTDDPTDYKDGELIASLSPDLLDHHDGNVKKAFATQKAIDADAMADPERIQRLTAGSDVTAIGASLREARRLKGKKVDDIAEQMGVSVPTVTGWETGSIDIPSSVLFRYIAILGMAPAEFFAGQQDAGVTTRAAHLADGAEELPPEAEKELAQLMDYLRHKYGKKQ